MSLSENLEPSDRELVLDFKKGNEDAFRKLMLRYKEKAMHIAWITTGNLEDAKDAAQEAFLKAHRNLSKFELRSEFSTWFYRVLTNAAHDVVRKQKWSRFLKWQKNEDKESFFETLKSEGASPEKDLLNSELGLRMSEAIKHLPFQQRWMFTLRYIKGFSIQQIAEVAEVSEGTVKATLHFAGDKFKKEIVPYLKEGQVGHE